MSDNRAGLDLAERRQRRVILALGGSLMALGVFVLIGWRAHLTSWLQIRPGWVAMQYNTALCFLGSGAALVLLARERIRVTMVLGIMLIGFASLAALQYFTGTDLHLDRLFFTPYSVIPADQPGRMPPVTAVCFALCGVAIFLGTGFRRRWFAVAGAYLLAGLVTLAAFLILLAYATGLNSSYGWQLHLRVATHTALGLFALGGGLLLWTGGELNRAGVRFRRWIALIVAAELLTVVGVYSALNFRELGRSMDENRRSYPVQQTLRSLEQAVDDCDTALGGYLRNRDQSDLEPHRTAVRNAGLRQAELTSLTGNDVNQAKRVAALNGEVTALLNLHQRLLTLSESQNAAALAQFQQREEERPILIWGRQLVAEIVTEERRLLDRRQDTMQREFRDTLWLLGLGGGLAGLLVFGSLVRAQQEANQRRVVERELQELNTELEQRVTQRSAALDRMNKEVRQAEQTLRLVVEAAPHALLMLDGAGQIVSANRAVATLFGYAGAELVGHPVGILLNEQLRSKSSVPSGAFFSPKEPAADYDLICRRKDGSEFPVETEVSPVNTPQGYFVLVSLTDLTLRREAQAKLNRLNAELEQQVGQRTTELAQALEHQRQTFDHAPIGMAVVSLEGRWRQVNHALCEILGYSEAELLGTDFQTLTHPDDLPDDREQVRRLLADEQQSYHKEKRYWHRSGRVVQALLHVSLIRDQEGRPQHSIAQIQDITARKEAATAVEQITERLQLATTGAGVGIWDWDVVTNAIQWDDQMYQLYGVKRGRFSGAYEAWESCIHPDDRARAIQELELALASRGFLKAVFRVVWPDGTIRHIRAQAVVHHDTAGKPVRILGTNWDVTDSVFTQEALCRSEEFVHRIIDLNPTLILVKDRTGRYTHFNRGAAEFFGVTPEQLNGLRDTDICLGPTTMARFQREDQQVLTTGRDLLLPEEEFLNAKGEARWLQRIKRPIQTLDGTVTHVLILVDDITERKQAEQQLERAKAAAETANQSLLGTNRQLEVAITRANAMAHAAETAAYAKAEFLATMSHEIRTPMNGVIGMTSLLLDTPLSREQSNYVEIVRSSGESLLVIINDILDFSKIESGKMTLEITPFDLRACLDQSLELFTVKGDEKQLRLTSHLDEAVPPTLLGDVTRLRQVLVNLVGNAVKFTAAGSVTVSVRPAGGSEEPMSTAGSLWQFSVRDTGIGISVDKLHLLFQSFQQVDSSTTRKFGGTGLGLAISRRLCELMGGRMWVESELGQGSVFHFTIRAQPARLQADAGDPRLTSTAPNANNASLVSERPFSILMAEDNRVNQLVAKKMFEKFGYRVDVVADGQEAIHAFEERPYDVIFMDLEMPTVSGYDAAKQIRSHASPGAPWIVALTAHAVEGIREECFAAGMNDYLTKPLKLEQLADALRRVPRSLTATETAAPKIHVANQFDF